jgi:hypothetical protein
MFRLGLLLLIEQCSFHIDMLKFVVLSFSHIPCLLGEVFSSYFLFIGIFIDFIANNICT